MNAKWTKYSRTLQEELRASRLREETLEHTCKQLERELTMTRMREQADRLEISALICQTINLQQIIDNRKLSTKMILFSKKESGRKNGKKHSGHLT